jgi:hypothetical protein
MYQDEALATVYQPDMRGFYRMIMLPSGAASIYERGFGLPSRAVAYRIGASEDSP